METFNTVLVKTLVVQFYRKNTGFFFVILAFAVGVLRNVEHYYIIMAVLHSYFLLSGLIVLWTLYLIKTINFTLQALSEKQNQFLYQLYLYPFRYKISGFLLVHILQFFPVILYMGVVISLGFAHLRFLSVGVCLLYFLLAAAVMLLICFRKLQHPGRESRLLKVTAAINQKFKKPAFSLFLFNILHNHKLSFLLTKTTACVLMILTAKLYYMGGYDGRLVSFALAVAGMANIVLVYYFHYFQNIELSLQKNLPLSLFKRFSTHALTLFMILLPETAVFVHYFLPYFHLLWIVQGVLLMLSIVLLLYSYLYTQSLALEIFIRRIFYLSLIYFFSILAGLPAVILVLVNTEVAYLIFIKKYYPFEYDLSFGVTD